MNYPFLKNPTHIGSSKPLYYLSNPSKTLLEYRNTNGKEILVLLEAPPITRAVTASAMDLEVRPHIPDIFVVFTLLYFNEVIDSVHGGAAGYFKVFDIAETLVWDPGEWDMGEEFVRFEIHHWGRRIATFVFPFIPPFRAKTTLGW